MYGIDMIKIYYVTYDVALKLKENGFNEPCDAYYHLYKGDESFELTGDDEFDFINSDNKYRIAAPTNDIVIHWFIEKHHIYFIPLFGLSKQENEHKYIWYFKAESMNGYLGDYTWTDGYHDTYESALNEIFIKALNYI